ncbi:DNA topoisomerase IB [Luteolibacter sp. SL250]|uniref:DNA topoisomerase IB n=1 Tax=Luteolibacter sp. SL250 TaxID=2995170 RepID=UPI00226EAF57|nr:DNA topoisomerase IB [Luteolibacter sp. SL250]WAC21465.1 DNA topoisomerase IB [Luteolibacter sp. SL250]
MKKPRVIAVRSEDGIVRLVYTTDTMPGYRRHRRGTGFSFLQPDGKVLADRAERRRILSLAVPPAYEDVWICMLENGHLQATGIDARGRKQYRYHPQWHAGSADRKYGLLSSFAAALPRIRQQVAKALSRPTLTRDRVIAGIVALLDSTGYRIGNARYEKENRTFGLSTLLNRHLREADGQLTLRFRGKAGQEHLAEIANPRLVRLVSELQELPGQHLFRYEDRDGGLHDIGTADVNGWLKEITGGDYTAKQFRTWKATVLCARELAKEPPPDTRTARERVIRQSIKDTALRLHHTPATCRKYYIHPALLAAYRTGDLFRIMHALPPRLRRTDGTAGLRSDERRVHKILESRTERRTRTGKSQATAASLTAITKKLEVSGGRM